ncbi:MAG: cell division protein ZapA [Nannocystaceae bacterium]
MARTSTRSVEVEVAGQRLTIRSDQGPEYVAELAAYVDAQIREIVGERRPSSLQRVIVLVAMQLADELFRERDLSRRMRERVLGRIAALEEAVAAHAAHLDALAAGESGE